ncbi:SRPBCC family protein [Yinghuangia seranimata]|uniref:SRPBCC family protein n=1 Tax=Yinghuangia seranimata TaxID=408067 RepID=UPI00248AEB1A|nr:SRPBCC family protein [Yinghuangia seranimata]MDI2124614.1 SRPBCC family protein [Yinghuangia seranimata]
MPRFELVTRINASAERVFDASLEVEVHTDSMAGSDEQAVGGVTEGRLALGDTVTWRARHFGVWWRMTSEITSYDRPYAFVDEQVRGPFAHWRHEHRFETDGAGTVMTDVIDYKAPLGPLGAIAERAVLHRYMVRLIRDRNEHIKTTLET